MITNGFIKLHRSLLSWGWYQDHTVKEVFLHLLLTAAFQPTEWRGVKLQPGQVLTNRVLLARELGLSEQQIRTAVDKLKSTGEIVCKATGKFIVITVVNWVFYQDGATGNQPEINRIITGNQPDCNRESTGTNNNKKERRKEGKKSSTAARACARPTQEQVEEFVREQGMTFDPVKFFSYYEERGWGFDWRRRAAEWQQSEYPRKKTEKPPSKIAAYDLDLFEEMLNRDDEGDAEDDD